MKVFLAILAVLGFITIYIFLGILTILVMSFFDAKEENISFKQAYLENIAPPDDEEDFGVSILGIIAIWPIIAVMEVFRVIGYLINKILEKIGTCLKDNKPVEDNSQEK